VRWRSAPEFAAVVSEFAGRPITYVEIGVWEGESAEYVAKNVLTHRRSRGYGIDPYIANRHAGQAAMDAHRERAVARLSAYPRWRWMFEPSQEALLHLDAPIVEAIYIDNGFHEAFGAIMDLCLAWRYLRVGSVVVLDDYRWGSRQKFPSIPEAVKAISSVFAGLLEPIRKPRWQASYRVIRKSCDETWLAEQAETFAGR
jgi:hypothetical protein